MSAVLEIQDELHGLHPGNQGSALVVYESTTADETLTITTKYAVEFEDDEDGWDWGYPPEQARHHQPPRLPHRVPYQDRSSLMTATATPSGEVRTTSSTGAEKGTKPERFDLLPAEALAAVARHYGVGAAKYSAHYWRKGYEWSKSYAALQRHANAFWAGEDIDEETGSPHMAGVAFHALSLITFMAEHPEMDDRFATVGAP